MAFPPYVHAVQPDDPQCWPIQPQGRNECGSAAPANALNVMVRQRLFDKDAFTRQAGLLFQRDWGGSPSFVTGQLIKRHGFGTHFGTLHPTSREHVLRDLIRRRVPVCVELGANRVGPFTIYGQHSVVLVGYSEPYIDYEGQRHQEYYFVDAQYPPEGSTFGLHTNDIDRDGDGMPEHFPGNRTIARRDFLNDYPTGIYFPVFPNQAEHDAWYRTHILQQKRMPLVGGVVDRFLSGTRDVWRAGKKA